MMSLSALVRVRALLLRPRPRLMNRRMIHSARIVLAQEDPGGQSACEDVPVTVPKRSLRPESADPRFPPIQNPAEELQESDEEELLREVSEGLEPEVDVDRRLRTLKRELVFLAYVGFPLPPSLTREQWRNLLCLERRASRNEYLDKLSQSDSGGQDEDGFQDVLRREIDAIELDKIGTESGFQEKYYTEEILAEGLSSEEARRRLGLAGEVARAMLRAGRAVPLLPPPRAKDRRELLRLSVTEERAASLLNYLLSNRTKREREGLVVRRAKERKMRLRAERILELRQKEEEDTIQAGRNTFGMRISSKRMKREARWHAVREFMPWGSPLVVDLSFLSTESIPTRMARSLFASIGTTARANVGSVVPSALHLTNYDRGSFVESTLAEIEPGYLSADNDELPYVVTDRSHLDLFPPSLLVYLSPDSPNELGYDVCCADDDLNAGDAVFVLGGVNVSPKGLTLGRAEEEGIRHARLPMERHIGISLDLDIACVVQILNDYRRTKDWFFAFRWMPVRFYVQRLMACFEDRSLQRYVLKAHVRLCPSQHPELLHQTPGQYRRAFAKILARNKRLSPAALSETEQDKGDGHQEERSLGLEEANEILNSWQSETARFYAIDRLNLSWNARNFKERKKNCWHRKEDNFKWWTFPPGTRPGWEDEGKEADKGDEETARTSRSS